MRQVHNMPDATAADVDVIEESNKPVRESTDAEDIMRKVDSGELVGVADNAIIFRSEIIVTDPEIKERIADALVEKLGSGSPGGM